MNAKGAAIMNILFSAYNASPQRLGVATGTAISVEARPGTAVRSLGGTVWVTQEGDFQDYIVPAGARFATSGSGNLVVSAIAGAACVAVSWSKPNARSLMAPGRVSVDYAAVRRLEREARVARSREIARLARCAWAWLAQTWRNALAGNGTKTRDTKAICC
jgi:hypothetical protein